MTQEGVTEGAGWESGLGVCFNQGEVGKASENKASRPGVVSWRIGSQGEPGGKFEMWPERGWISR